MSPPSQLNQFTYLAGWTRRRGWYRPEATLTYHAYSSLWTNGFQVREMATLNDRIASKARTSLERLKIPKRGPKSIVFYQPRVAGFAHSVA